MTQLLYITIFLYGIIIGSFLNVCIYRIPLKENITTTRSHCMNCGYLLKWYDLFPLFSYLLLKGRCRNCKEKISIQYPLIELVNGILYLWIFFVNGFNTVSMIYCLLASALLALSMIDIRTYEIPFGINVFIGILGIIRVLQDYQNWLTYIIGFCSVSLFLLFLYEISDGRAIGGGDIKLMAAAGLVLGWKSIILAFFGACILGSVIHIIRMKISKEEHILAFGPYLSMGIFLTMLYGESFLTWYINICLG